ncbi:hypothetical protein B0H17DRAFT_1006605 [Mycena rosella]|uniref:MYND-type domain-containing protein n=1 Tax=Mycena rosella TaxID=1033263 RepID=A0AAD7DTH0_MYCRO|nr:hypothetical protein B0H17DRAFT_1006605 [Mycena rosella]
MPGPGRKTKAKASPRSGASGSTSADSNARLAAFIGTIDNADGWSPVVNLLCAYFELPDITTRSGLKKVHANFDSIYRRLDKAYTQNASNVRIKGGIVGIYARMCVDSLLRNKLFQRGFLAQLFPLLDVPECRRLALRSLTTITHHGGIEIRMEIAKSGYLILLRILQEYPDDPKTVELSIVTLSHCLISTISDEGVKIDRHLGESLDLTDILKIVTDTIRRPFPSRILVDHSVQLLAMSTLHSDVPPTSARFLVAGLRSKDWIFRCTCLGGLVRLHRKQSESDQRALDPMKLMAAVSRPAPPHLSEILRAYGFQQCEAYLTMKTASDFQSAMMNCVSTRDLYSLGLSLASFILRTEFSVSEGAYQSPNSVTGQMESMDLGLPFTMWSDSLPHCAKAIRAKGVPAEADMADILDMKFSIMRQRIPEAVRVANAALKRNPDFAYAYYALTLASDPVVGLRAAKKGMKCTKITPFVRFQMMQRAVEQAGEMGIQMLQENASEGDKKWEEGIAFLISALEDSKTYIAQAPPDNRHMKNVLYWNILLRIAIDEEISADLRELQVCILRKHDVLLAHRPQGSIRKLKIADDFSKWIGITPPRTNLRLTQQTVVRLFPEAVEEWGEFITNNSRLDGPAPSTEKAEDDLAAWLGDVHLEGEDQCHQPATFNTSHLELYRCSWCGNPSAVLRKCAGCAKSRYCDASCQKSHWKDHKRACSANKTN